MLTAGDRWCEKGQRCLLFLVLHGLLYVSGIKNAFRGLSNPYFSIILPCDLCVGLTVKRTFTDEGEVSDECCQLCEPADIILLVTANSLPYYSQHVLLWVVRSKRFLRIPRSFRIFYQLLQTSGWSIPTDLWSLAALCRITRVPQWRTLYLWHPCLAHLLAVAWWARSAASC